MASSSGTVGQTVYDVATLIEHAYRLCGKIPSTISGEQLLSARENLGLLMIDLVNDGINLWCINKTVLPVVQGRQSYSLPPGTADIISANYRTSTAYTPSSSTTATGYVMQDLGSAVQPANAQISFSVATQPSLVVESSVDGSTWIQQAQFETQYSSVPAGQALSVDIENPPFAQFWRVRDTSGTIASVSALAFNYNQSEVPMTPFNRDDYNAMPNKAVQASKCLQYFFDKQVSSLLRVWPTANASTDQIVLMRHRQVQDIGAFTNLIEAPQRWYNYIKFALGYSVGLELPAGEVDPGRLQLIQQEKMNARTSAENGETDGSPIKVSPNLRGYTR